MFILIRAYSDCFMTWGHKCRCFEWLVMIPKLYKEQKYNIQVFTQKYIYIFSKPARILICFLFFWKAEQKMVYKALVDMFGKMPHYFKLLFTHMLMNTYEIHTASCFHRNTSHSNTVQPPRPVARHACKKCIIIIFLCISVYSIYKVDVFFF